MRSAILQSAFTGLVLTVAIAFTGPAKAEVVNLKATLDAKAPVRSRQPTTRPARSFPGRAAILA